MAPVRRPLPPRLRTSRPSEQEKSSSRQAIAERLIQLRTAMRMSQREIAALTKIGDTAWNNYERGTKRISVDNVAKLRRIFGVTSDWIYWGDVGTLPPNVANRIFPPAGSLRRLVTSDS